MDDSTLQAFIMIFLVCPFTFYLWSALFGDTGWLVDPQDQPGWFSWLVYHMRLETERGTSSKLVADVFELICFIWPPFGFFYLEIFYGQSFPVMTLLLVILVLLFEVVVVNSLTRAAVKARRRARGKM